MKEGVRTEWHDDLEKSMDVFDRLIRPALHRLIYGDFKCIRVEGTEEEIAKYLDQNIGIDAMIETEKAVYGLASRIQMDTGVWNTFTIRCERESGHITELEKLRNAIKHDAMRPHMTLQAYVMNDTLQSIAIARTKDIIAYIDSHECKRRKSYDGKGSAEFVVVNWGEMQSAGYRVDGIRNEQGGAA